MAQITGTHYEPPAGGSVFGQSESGDGEMPGKHLVSLLQQVSKGSMGKIDNLIGDLQTLRSKLQTDGDRIQRDTLRNTLIQLTTIISESVEKLPRGPGINGRRDVPHQ